MVFFLLLSASCSKPKLPGPQPYPVHGKVLYQGQPARRFRVVFYPLVEQKKLRFAPAAITDENGEYRLGSYASADGAPAGEYAVTFQWPKQIVGSQESDPVPEVDQLQGRYSDPKKSLLKVTVREGENELKPFLLP